MKRKDQEEILGLCDIIGMIAWLNLAVAVYLGTNVIDNEIASNIVIAFGVVMFIANHFSCVAIECKIGQYKCKECNHAHIPDDNDSIFSRKKGNSRYLRCPRCGKKTWHKKVLADEKIRK